MMIPRRLHQRWITEKASADGNCAYNAAALALSETEMLDAIEANLSNPNAKLTEFIKLAAEALKVPPTWQTIKTSLIRLKQEKRFKQLEKALAPVLRKLSGMLITQQESKPYKEGRKQALLADFDNYISNALFKTKIARDDIYNLAPISEKYDALAEEFKFENLEKYTALKSRKRRNPKEEREFQRLDHEFELAIKALQESLGTWWDKGGFQKFLTLMQEDGTWSGDLELVPLFQYFGVDFQVKAARFGDHPVEIYSARGVLLPTESKLDVPCIQEIIGRKIVEGPGKNAVEIRQGNLALKWPRISELELQQTLAAVPQIELVREALDEEPEKYSRVPDELCENETLIQQLQRRGVVTRRSTHWEFACDYTQKTQRDAALQRIAACPQSDVILSQWRETYRQAPTVTLENAFGSHWNHVKLVTEMIAVTKRKNSGVSESGMFGKSVEAKAKRARTAPADTIENSPSLGRS